MIRAVLFDLDDTLYPQISWLDGALWATADAGKTFGADRLALLCTLRKVVAQGSDRGNVIDRALKECDCTHIPVPPLVDAFRSHRPATLKPYPGVVDAMTALHAHVPIGIVTDGEVAIQRAKLRALGLEHVDTVVFSDDYGREHRKPDPLPFRRALDALHVDPREAVFIGDRPDKDIAGAHRVGMRAIRVRSGEYSTRPDRPRPWASVRDAVEAIHLLLTEIAQGASGEARTPTSFETGT